MRSTLSAQLLLAASALAVPTFVNSPAPILVARDLASIQGALTTVQTALDKLATAVNAVTASDPNTLTALLAAATDTQNTLGTATTTINASPVLSIPDALTLQKSTGGLTTSANKTVEALIAKKPVFDQAGVTSVVAQQLATQKTNSKALGDAVVSKIPAIGQGIAQQSITPINAGIDKAIAVYGGAAGAAPAPASAAAAPAAAAPAASAPAPAAASAPASSGGSCAVGGATAASPASAAAVPAPPPPAAAAAAPAAAPKPSAAPVTPNVAAAPAAGAAAPRPPPPAAAKAPSAAAAADPAGDLLGLIGGLGGGAAGGAGAGANPLAGLLGRAE